MWVFTVTTSIEVLIRIPEFGGIIQFLDSLILGFTPLVLGKVILGMKWMAWLVGVCGGC